MTLPGACTSNQLPSSSLVQNCFAPMLTQISALVRVNNPLGMQASVTYCAPELVQMLRNLAQNAVYAATVDAAASALSCGFA